MTSNLNNLQQFRSKLKPPPLLLQTNYLASLFEVEEPSDNLQLKNGQYLLLYNTDLEFFKQNGFVVLKNVLTKHQISFLLKCQF